VLAGPASATPSCPLTSPTTNQATTVLQQLAEPSNAGVVYDGATTQLRLKKTGGNVKFAYGTKLGTADPTGAVLALIKGCPTKWTATTQCASNPTFSVRLFITRASDPRCSATPAPSTWRRCRAISSGSARRGQPPPVATPAQAMRRVAPTVRAPVAMSPATR
jgi:hypothetical protein